MTFPLSIDAFFGDIGVAEMTFHPMEAIERSETTGGEILVSEYGPRLWEGRATIRAQTYDLIEEAAARIRAVQSARGSFFATPIHKWREGAGGVLTAATFPWSVRLTVAPGEVIRRGEFFSFAHGSSPVRYAMHQATETVVANSSGLTPLFDVVPQLRPGYTLDQAVNRSRPVCKAVIVPGSVTPPAFSEGVGGSIAFNWRQTLR